MEAAIADDRDKRTEGSSTAGPAAKRAGDRVCELVQERKAPPRVANGRPERETAKRVL